MMRSGLRIILFEFTSNFSYQLLPTQTDNLRDPQVRQETTEESKTSSTSPQSAPLPSSYKTTKPLELLRSKLAS
jgi:hypothetical protein